MAIIVLLGSNHSKVISSGESMNFDSNALHVRISNVSSYTLVEGLAEILIIGLGTVAWEKWR